MPRVYGKRRSDPAVKIDGSKTFSLGLSQQGHPSVIKKNELAEALNVLYTQNGIVEKRPGSIQLGDLRGTSTAITALQAVYDIGGHDYVLRISSDGILQKYNNDSDIWVDISGSPTFSNVKTYIIQSWGFVYIVNPTDPLTKWDGSTFVQFTALANPTVAPTAVKVGIGRVSNVTVANGGSGYSVGQVLTLGASGDHNCTLTIKAVSSGVVTAVEITTPGSGYSVATGLATTVSPAGGSGCTLNITSTLGTGTRTNFYRYVWYNNAGNTLASANVSVTNLPEKMDAESYVTLTMPSAPTGAVKTGIFRGITDGDEVYLTSINASVVEYNDKDFDSDDPLTGIPANNNTGGYHFEFATVYNDTLIGVTTEMGKHCLVYSAGGDKFDSFGRADGGGYYYWRKDDGDPITAVAVFQEELYTFKRKKIGAFKFITTGTTLRDINLASGAVSFDSVHAAGNDLRYWSDDGAMALGNEPNFSVIRTRVLSARAEKLVQSLTTSDLSSVSGIYYKNHSLWGIPMGTKGQGNTSCLVYDERFVAWSEWFGLTPKMWCKFLDEDEGERLLFADSQSAQICEAWKGKTDRGNPVVWRVTTKQFDGDVPYQYKTYSRVFFVFGNVQGADTQINLIENGYRTQAPLAMYNTATGSQGFGVDQWGTMEFGDSSGEYEGDVSGINVRFANVGNKDLFSLQASFSNEGLEDVVQLMGMYIEYANSSMPLPASMELQRVYT